MPSCALWRAANDDANTMTTIHSSEPIVDTSAEGIALALCRLGIVGAVFSQDARAERIELTTRRRAIKSMCSPAPIAHTERRYFPHGLVFRSSIGKRKLGRTDTYLVDFIVRTMVER